MKKQLPLFIFLILGLCFIGSTACQNNQTGINSTNQNQTVSNGKQNPSPTVSSKTNLKVTQEFWKQQLDKANEKRDQPTGERPPGLNVMVELCCGVPKQSKRLQEMVDAGYVQPLDFADLAEKRAKGELVELPLATETYLVDFEEKVTEDEFSSFSFEERTKPLQPDSPKFAFLKKLADDFDGEKYDLNNPKDRKQMRIRLLRMINPEAKKVIEEVADSYQKKFNRPLKISDMVRSMDYQIDLNKTNANSFKVMGKDSRPPHTSGYAFDIARKHLTAEEQNFIIQKLAEMENNGKLDGLIEYGARYVFHVFVYQDGKPPKME
ncbi:MAG: hypothetical protein K1X72_01090 [Pyrinomonadaceae bacterium]|nr:hypothetical protein [Pyrinomonadaceae bacterium]